MRTAALLLLALGATACSDRPAAPAASAAPAPDGVPYRFSEPDVRVELPDVLSEISGLTVLPSGHLGAVQDERGTIYEVDPATGRIVDELSFFGSGDFEGIELTPDAVWTVRSDGDLYRVARAADGSVATEKTETALSSRNDVEGLAYDPAGDRLLLVCKEDPGSGLDGVRAVYAFSLASRQLSARPVFTIPRSQIDTDDAFKPSALAVHPATGHVYVLSSVRKAVAVLGADGALLTVRPLPEGLFPQPEGLAFTADGTLYISNEGPSGPATLLRFSPADA